MTALQNAQTTYLRSRRRADEARARYVALIRRERENGRTWDAIGQELGLTRQRVMRIAREEE